MKFAVLTSTLAAAVIAASAASASPVPAGPTVLAGVSVYDGRVAAHLTLASHRRVIVRDHRRHGRFGRCEGWPFAHRKLHRRFGHVRLLRTFFNRRGDRIFIAYGHSYRGRPVRVRYNACLGRVMAVTPLRHHHRRGWRR